MSSQYDIFLSSLWWNVYLYINDSNKQNIYDKMQKIKSIIVNILQN